MSRSLVVFLPVCRPSLKLSAKPFFFFAVEEAMATENSWRLEIGVPSKLAKWFHRLQASVENISSDSHKRNSCSCLGLFTRGSLCPWIFTSDINTTASWQKEGGGRKKKYKGRASEANKSKSGLSWHSLVSFSLRTFGLREKYRVLESERKGPRPPTSLQNCCVIWWYLWESQFVHCLAFDYARCWVPGTQMSLWDKKKKRNKKKQKTVN